jgi:iron-sulfur cluster assembly protein
LPRRSEEGSFRVRIKRKLFSFLTRHKSMIHLSPAAVREIKRLKSKHENPNALFRLGVGAGGCAGLYYIMEFASVKPDDRVCQSSGIQVAVDGESVKTLTGLTLDYSEDLMGGGFRFHNPNATASCGCGHSFSTGSGALLSDTESGGRSAGFEVFEEKI